MVPRLLNINNQGHAEHNQHHYIIVAWAAQLMGETTWEKGVETASCDLRFPAVSCGFLQFSAPPNHLPCRSRTKSAKIFGKLPFLPFSLSLSKTKTPQTVTLQVTILCQQISKKKQHAPEHSFALTLRRSFVTIFWQKNLSKLQLAVLPFAVF